MIIPPKKFEPKAEGFKIKVFLFFLSIVVVAFPAYGEVVFRDDIAVTGKAVTLMAETKGKLFRRGGEVVEFFVNGLSIGSVLSGGDGFAYKEFTPRSQGLLKIKVKPGRDKAEGFLLSLKKGSSILFIDVAGSLFEGPFSQKPKEGSLKAVKKILTRFPVAYVKTSLPAVFLKEWLNENGFPPAPLVGLNSLDELMEKGLRIKAVVGGTEIISAVKDNKIKKFSFEEIEGATEVKDWKEMERGL